MMECVDQPREWRRVYRDTYPVWRGDVVKSIKDITGNTPRHFTFT